MNKLQAFLEKHFVPFAKRNVERPWVKVIGDSMQAILPFILTGSIIFLYNVIRSYLKFLPDLQFIANFSFGMLGLITAFFICRIAMLNFKHIDYAVNAPLTAVITYLIFTKPSIIENIFSTEMSKFGPVGILPGMIIGVLIAQIFRLYSYLPLKEKIEDSEIPDFVGKWINNIIPIALSILVANLFSTSFEFDLFKIIQYLFTPLQSFGESLPGLIVLTIIPCIMMSLGISSWSFNAISTPIYFAGINANLEAIKMGKAATNIVTSETVFTASLITMGGIGCTLALNLLMLRSKSKKLKTLGKITIAPSLFGINEPVLFGAPVVLNPLLMLPMWLCTLTGSIIVWIIMKTGLLNIPVTPLFTGQMPVGISTFIATNDFRGIIWFIVLLAIYLMIYYPFFKAYERTLLADDKQL
ncbi:PTS sugar transporter subunit IIC [Helcococcus kunzii]|uniref:PTS sugar transporter subunit IIC n=1 Tax=Helcococcus kunzii TaxID=40091 RepID=UPI0024ACB4AA|nr:PTS transporter subunit EIIC [Helcococcus kunzii]